MQYCITLYVDSNNQLSVKKQNAVLEWPESLFLSKKQVLLNTTKKNPKRSASQWPCGEEGKIKDWEIYCVPSSFTIVFLQVSQNLIQSLEAPENPKPKV